MPIIFHTIVPRIEYGPTTDIYIKHTRSQNVPRIQCIKGTSLIGNGDDGVIINAFNFVQTGVQLLFGIQHITVAIVTVVAIAMGVIGGIVTGTHVLHLQQTNIIPQQQSSDGLGGVGHIDATAEVGPFR
jgi:hypothetical protein